MTTRAALERPQGIAVRRRIAAKTAVGAARLIAFLPPTRIRSVLGVLTRGARPASYAEAKAARDSVMRVSLSCLGPMGCLPRSLATALLCRVRGTWPTWRVGARAMPPFGAHAWVEAEGRLVGEDLPEGYLVPLIEVAPRGSTTRS